ncbi:hypothetical protein AB6A23_15395 [Paenibacillus tarimensis]
MRWTTFIAGGIAGFTAAAIVARRRPEVLVWVSNAAGEVWTNLRNRGIETALSASLPKSHGGSAERSGEAWSRFEQFIESDPAVKQEAAKIMLDNEAAQTH